MTNTKKTGVRALAWVLAFALIALSIPLFALVPAVTASAEDTVVAQWSIPAALEGTLVSIKYNKQGTDKDKTTFKNFIIANIGTMTDGNHYIEIVLTGTFPDTLQPAYYSGDLLGDATNKGTLTVKDSSGTQVALPYTVTANALTYSSKNLTLSEVANRTANNNFRVQIEQLTGATVTSFTFTIYEKGTSGTTEASQSGTSEASQSTTEASQSTTEPTTKPTEDPTPSGNDKVIVQWSADAVTEPNGFVKAKTGTLGSVTTSTLKDISTSSMTWTTFFGKIQSNSTDVTGENRYIEIVAKGDFTGATTKSTCKAKSFGITGTTDPPVDSASDTELKVTRENVTVGKSAELIQFIVKNNDDKAIDVMDKPITITVTIYEKGSSEPQATKIAVPTAVTGLIYNGEVQTGVEEGVGYTLTGNTATDAGEYTATATLETGYVWDDDSAEAQEIKWSIAKATPTAGLFKFSAPKDDTYDGDDKVAEVQFNSSELTGCGNVKVLYKGDDSWTEEAPKNAGTYAVSISVDEGPNFTAADSLTNDDWKFTITKAEVEIPEAAIGLIYNGEVQTGVEGSDLYTVQGGTATNADEYTATAALNDTTNYVWTNGSGADQTIDWSIAKATDNVITGVPAIKGWVKGETASAVDMTGVSATYGTPEAVYYTDANCQNTIDFASITEVGTYYVRAEVAETDNYNGAVSAAVAFKVTDPAVANATYSAALTLNNDIDINLQVEGFGKDFDPNKLTVKVDGEPVETTYKAGILTCKAAEVHPNEMAVEHEIEVSYNDMVVKEFTYSVRKYCDAVFAAYKDHTTDPLYQLCKAVLNYGAWVDKYVKELNKVETPESDINAGYEITSFEEINQEKVVTDQLAIDGCITGGACSLELGSTITMNFFVNTNGATINTDDPNADIMILNNEGNRVDPENIEVENKGGNQYLVSVKNISASKLSRSYKLMFMSDMEAAYVDGDTIKQVADKTTSYLQYSVYTYCDYVLDHKTDTTYTETLKTLCQAIYNYGEVANAYEIK